MRERVSSSWKMSPPHGLPMAEVWSALAGCALAAIYLAIRFGLAGGVAALGACLFDALTALALSAVFGWALPVEGSFPAAIACVCVVSLLASALTLNRYRETLRAPGASRLDAAAVVRDDARRVRGPRALRRRAAAAGEPVHAGAGTGRRARHGPAAAGGHALRRLDRHGPDRPRLGPPCARAAPESNTR